MISLRYLSVSRHPFSLLLYLIPACFVNAYGGYFNFGFRTLRARLSAVMKRDEHAVNGVYHIRSMYFDNLYDKALREKIDGVNIREIFRIRFYNGDTSFIVLEKKSKINGLCAKESCRITEEEAQKIVDGNLGFCENCWNTRYIADENGKKVKHKFKETAFIDLAGKHGIVPSSVDRIYQGAIDKLRKALEDDRWL